RAKISHDPNNTAWTRSASNFGQKVLLSQGWTPGTVLGASNASYTTSSASFSHVKVIPRSDNIGLGATKGPLGDNETTGLGGLQHLLGRLNGKSQQELQTEDRNREGARRKLYADRRWGFGNFVSAGFLVGDKIQSTGDENLSGAPRVPIGRKNPQEALKSDEQELRRMGKGKGSGSMLGGVQRTGPADVERLPRNVHSRSPPHLGDRVSEMKHPCMDEDLSGKFQRKGDKTERKARRRARKEKKAAAKVTELERLGLADATGQKSRAPEAVPPNVGVDQGQGRHTIRRRFIQQKKLSSMDPKALNEILMIRA
ncbi:MAG: hypothetical protein Q9183_006145, partial [Haloplaca sp. 2 TL-2023]